ncbi:hypothetical protein [Providencia hangzhouensis]|uniref:hypothetical protein n=1 Tax=Providencia hangzhouensis TaxID=3031799 RepID=UPI0034DD2B90
MGMRTKELNGDECFLELKKHYEYMNGIIQELHAELGELAEKILKTETKRKSILIGLMNILIELRGIGHIYGTKGVEPYLDEPVKIKIFHQR